MCYNGFLLSDFQLVFSGEHAAVLTTNGFGFYQPYPSQLEKFCLRATGHALLSCALELKEGMRPVETVEEPVLAKEEKTEEKNEEPEQKK